MLVRWLIGYQLRKAPPVPAAAEPLMGDLVRIFGFAPGYLAREWAFSRKERMELLFGTPDIRGPLETAPVTPGGYRRREDYVASSTEATLLTAEERRRSTQEAFTLSTANLRQALNGVYYSGAGSVDQLTGAASKSLLAEERRSVVLSLIQMFSETRQEAAISHQVTSQSSTRVIRAPGVDPRLGATHHSFKVVVPVTATVEMHDVGLTWCPRIRNPFFLLRKAIRRAYQEARDSHLMQYYVPEPITPPVVWEQYTLTENVYMNSEGDDNDVSDTVTLYVPQTDRQDNPDFVNAIAEFQQDRGTWRNDSDEWTVAFEILSYSGGTIRCKVSVDTADDQNWQGYVYITIPVLRYSTETVNALAAHAVAMRDYELAKQALSAQAHQYARIKQREFIERHESMTALNKIVFDALMRRVCRPALAEHASYYKEVVARCIDWPRVKIELEPARMDKLYMSDFPADHFVNSRAVRFFLPVVHTAEGVFFDALNECGTFQVQASVAHARDRIAAERNRLGEDGPDQLDRFNTDMVLGDHIEPVMSTHDHAT
jgi:hypothetical protein